MRADGSRAAASALWALAGTGLIISAFLPWTTKGVLATSSPLDAVRLIKSGVLDDSVPPGASVVLLGLPAVGVGFLGLAGLDGRVVRTIRLVLFALGVLLVVGSAQVLADASLGRLSGGAWVAVVSLLSALAALGLSVRGLRDPRLQEDVR